MAFSLVTSGSYSQLIRHCLSRALIQITGIGGGVLILTTAYLRSVFSGNMRRSLTGIHGQLRSARDGHTRSSDLRSYSLL